MLVKLLTAVTPVTGATTPAMRVVVIVASVIAKFPVVTTPELIGFVVVAPVTVKAFAATPLNV